METRFKKKAIFTNNIKTLLFYIINIKIILFFKKNQEKYLEVERQEGFHGGGKVGEKCSHTHHNVLPKKSALTSFIIVFK
jgi:hypothetical protein